MFFLLFFLSFFSFTLFLCLCHSVSLFPFSLSFSLLIFFLSLSLSVLLSVWSFIICPVPFNCKSNVLSASLNKTFPFPSCSHVLPPPAPPPPPPPPLSHWRHKSIAHSQQESTSEFCYSDGQLEKLVNAVMNSAGLICLLLKLPPV